MKKNCFFCIEPSKEIDYKDTELLRRFTSPYGRILSRRRKGTCAKHQRKLSQAIKRARMACLLPFCKQ